MSDCRKGGAFSGDEFALLHPCDFVVPVGRVEELERDPSGITVSIPSDRKELEKAVMDSLQRMIERGVDDA